MAQFSDWISRMFTSGQARGLSGDMDELSLDPRDAWYNSRLRRHQSVDDFIDDPAMLWSCVAASKRRFGLREHFESVRNEGPPDFTDILIVVNEADWRRTFNRVSAPWAEAANRTLGGFISQYASAEGFSPLFAHRGFRLRFIQDGGAEMRGESMGLIKGEFVSGLLPNLYTGVTERSRPVIAVHLNVPGAWDDFREVGRLYSDQVQFTLGSHWLDNFSHEALREPALYRLQQYLDGSFLHIISPDLQGRYEVTSDDSSGTPILVISEKGGDPIAYMVLALLDSFTTSAPPVTLEEDDGRPGGAFAQDVAAAIAAAAAQQLQYTDPSYPGGPTTNGPATPMPRATLPGLAGTKTIVPDSVQERIFTLKERGALLQKLHFRKFMQGYDVYVTDQGAVNTVRNDPAATFQVRDDKVQLVVHKSSVTVNSARVTLNTPLALGDHAVLRVGPHVLEYNDLSKVKVDGWPYLGEILRPASSTHMVFGGTYRVGRDRRCKVQLPDEPQNDNIVWLESAVAGNTIRARSGDIPKSRFYTDSIMVASEHVEIDIQEEPTLKSIARHCFTYVRRNGEALSLQPANSPTGATTIPLRNGDDLLVGNCLFAVSFPPMAAASAGARPMVPRRLTAESLVNALDGGDEGPSSPSAAPALPNRPSEPSVPPPVGARSPVRTRLAAVERTSPDETEERPTQPQDHPAPSRAEPFVPRRVATTQDIEPPPRRPDLRPPSDPRPRLPLAAEDLPTPSLSEGAFTTDPPRPSLGGDSALSPGALPKGSSMSEAELPTVRFEDEEDGFAEPPPKAPEPVSSPPSRPVVAERPAEPTRPAEPARPPTGERVPMAVPASAEEDDIIAVVDEAAWQLELARPARLLQIGWAITGDVVIGNFKDCGVIVPESRSEPHQLFHAAEYFRLKVRGNRGKVELLDPVEARLRVNGEAQNRSLELDGLEMEIIRRDADHDEDFSVVLRLRPEVVLPDPRAQLLGIDYADRMALALFTVGLPLSAPRHIRLGQIRARATFDGTTLTLTDYLDTYQQKNGHFLPFMVSAAGGPFSTVPEDGRALVLRPGDRLLADKALFEFGQRGV
ncbi:MAG: hypothetical protein IPI35_22215 [Deltaproteobacteria bacterium]|nr:hypothetical protein [Deltaproteobacteria bacterium]